MSKSSDDAEARSAVIFGLVVFFLMGGCTGGVVQNWYNKRWLIANERAYYNPATGEVVYDSPRKEPQPVDKYFGEPRLEMHEQ